jgi:hypothetical protein
MALQKEARTVPKQIGDLAYGLAQVIAKMDEKKLQSQNQLVYKAQKTSHLPKK